MANHLERICQHCGKTNYGVLHHCLNCGAELPTPLEDAETLIENDESRFEAPTIVERPPEPDAFLEVTSGEDLGHRYELFDGIKFGRSKTCDIVIDSPKASREHALIILNESQQWLLNDLESTNGTQLNNRRITAPTILYNGDEIYIEGYQFKVIIKKPYDIPAVPQQIPTTSPDFDKEPHDTGQGCQRNTIIIVVAGVIMLVCFCAAAYFGWTWISDNLLF